jgi:hypothetical protein
MNRLSRRYPAPTFKAKVALARTLAVGTKSLEVKSDSSSVHFDPTSNISFGRM